SGPVEVAARVDPPPSPPGALSSPARSPEPSRPEPSPCDRLADQGRGGGGGGRLFTLAVGAGSGAARGLFPGAGLEGDGLANRPAALATLESYRRRFPQGASGDDADLMHLELLRDTGKPRAALAESAALLAQRPEHKRRAEIHLFRGDTYRDALGD